MSVPRGARVPVARARATRPKSSVCDKKASAISASPAVAAAPAAGIAERAHLAESQRTHDTSSREGAAAAAAASAGGGAQAVVVMSGGRRTGADHCTAPPVRLSPTSSRCPFLWTAFSAHCLPIWAHSRNAATRRPAGPPVLVLEPRREEQRRPRHAQHTQAPKSARSRRHLSDRPERCPRRAPRRPSTRATAFVPLDAPSRPNRLAGPARPAPTCCSASV